MGRTNPRRGDGPSERPIAFALKTPLEYSGGETLSFEAQKTMYGGKTVRRGDTVFIFASENEGGDGLVARGKVDSAYLLAKAPGVARQTPRVTLRLRVTGLAKRPLGRSELRDFRDWLDGRAETELNFKLYRQATNKLVGVSEKCAAFLERSF